MQFPDAVNRLLGQLHADCFVGVTDEREIAANAIDGISDEDRRAVSDFLGRFLASEHNMRDLESQWERSPADVRLGSGREILVFFGLVRDALKEGS